jgi:hypothetical protein
MKKWFANYFSSTAEVSGGMRALSVVLAVLLFFALVIFGIILSMQLSVFNTNYFASYVDDADLSAFSRSWLNENVAPDRPIVAKAAELGINYFEPQIKEQLHSAVRNIHGFFLNRLENGKLLETVSEQRPLITDVATNMQTVLNIPIVKSIIENFGLDPNFIQSYVDVQQINEYFDMIERLARYQALVVFAKNIYIPLIVILLVLIIGMLFTTRRLKQFFIMLGTVFAVYGIIQLISLIPVGTYGRLAIAGLDLSPTVNDVILRFLGDITTTIMIFSAVILFCGMLFIGGYFIYKPAARS